MWKRLFRPDPARIAGQSLYARCAQEARNPGFYTDLGVPDTVEGRFELYALHVILVVERLKGQGERASVTSQALFDALLRGLDDGLREMGVGDLSVGKKMRKLGEALYGRAKNLDEALASLPDETLLRGFLQRTVYADLTSPGLDGLVRWVSLAHRQLSAESLDDVLAGQVTFPDVGLGLAA